MGAKNPLPLHDFKTSSNEKAQKKYLKDLNKKVFEKKLLSTSFFDSCFKGKDIKNRKLWPKNLHFFNTFFFKKFVVILSESLHGTSWWSGQCRAWGGVRSNDRLEGMATTCFGGGAMLNPRGPKYAPTYKDEKYSMNASILRKRKSSSIKKKSYSN